MPQVFYTVLPFAVVVVMVFVYVYSLIYPEDKKIKSSDLALRKAKEKDTSS